MSSEPDYRRKKQGVKAPNPSTAPANGFSGPKSQIPGLSQSAETGPEERTKGRRVGIFATDSDYVKLAKQGGQKGLLWHEDTDGDGRVDKRTYKAPDWFSANSAPTEPRSPTGDATSPESSARGAVSPLAAPFGTDNISPWDCDSFTSGASKDKVAKVGEAASQMEKMTVSEHGVAGRFKKISYDKKSSPVSMSKLLSFAYVEDEEKKSTNDDDASSVTSEQTSTVAPEDELE
ncbi:uncharacterized protein C7orf57 homolog [Denticeps clupeoides]|uniref:Uncharacterized protein n=1 Tax=Denticeps clupeoides TaxID=299321 RepID=A0AAY4AL68_9TELE|nr:uncharacterized protein C7orf57-like [Denticeps clupeoides]